ncbi:carboxypeptidase-like regulatory domain-containing protein [Dethiosulfovibrio peptidovorans]|nr:carboxypeptidase-like regulatory domain-containing protein [Dethiosulfovibrio peptidovorans]
MSRGFMKRWAVFLVLIVGSAFLLGGCGSSGDDPGPTPAPTTSGVVSISGQVANSVPTEISVAATERLSAMKVSRLKSGSGLAGVDISAKMEGWELKKTSSDKSGFYAFDVPVPSEGGRLVLTFSKDGSITYQKAITVKPEESHSVHATLLPVAVDKEVKSGDIVSDDNGRIEIEAPRDGNLTLFVGDPTSADGAAVFPGDYMAATSADDVPLVSMAFFEATLTDPSGDKIERFDPVEVSMLLPEDYRNGTLKDPQGKTYVASGDSRLIASPDEFTCRIEWWSYDDDGAMWVQEDAMTPGSPSDPMKKAWITSGDGGKLYVNAKVNHFSWWNADYPQEFSYFCVKVVDGDGEPMENVAVYSSGVTYKNTSQPKKTDKDGWARGIVVKKSTSKADRERAQVYALAGNVKFFYDVKSDGEGVVASDDIYTPYDENECGRTDGRPSIELDEVIRISFEGVVTGTVTNDSGKALSGVKVYSSVGGVAETDSSGSYSLNVPVGAEVTVYIAGVEGKTATVSDKDTPKVLDFTVANQPPVITKLSRTPEGNVAAGSSTTFTGEAMDPEGGTVTYGWTASEGSFSGATGASTVWTAPAGSGNAQITFTATDSDEKTSAMTVPVSWGSLPSPGRLVVNLKDDDGDPVVGAWVVLHKDDGSVEEYRKTDARGKANFGDIGRKTATISYAYESDRETVTDYGYQTYVQKDLNRNIVTAVGVPVAELTIVTEVLGDEVVEDREDPNYNLNISVDPSDLSDETNVTCQPLGNVYLNNWTTSQDNVPVYPDDLQSDGNLTLLSMAKVWEDETEKMTSWGVLYDETPKSGDSYTLPLDKKPVNLPWSSEKDIISLSVMAERKGVEYDLFNLFQHEFMMTGSTTERREVEEKSLSEILDRAAKSGTIQLPDFDGDVFFQDALALVRDETVSTDITSVEEKKRLGSSLPDKLAVSLPDYSFTNVSVDSSGINPELTWTLSTTQDIDAMNAGVSEEAYSSVTSVDGTVNTHTQVNWDVFFEKGKGTQSYTFPSLPEDLEAWFDDVEGDPTFTVSVIDYDNLTGYSSLMDLVLSGQDPEKSALRILEADFPGALYW